MFLIFILVLVLVAVVMVLHPLGEDGVVEHLSYVVVEVLEPVFALDVRVGEGFVHGAEVVEAVVVGVVGIVGLWDNQGF